MHVEHFDVVQRVAQMFPPQKTVLGALDFTLHVIAQLPPEERAGLLSKPAGENIAPFRGVLVSVGRICYPDGTLYKVLTDIPTTNGPEWAYDDTRLPTEWVEVPMTPPAEQPPPTSEPPETDLNALVALVEESAAAVVASNQQLANAVQALGTRIDSIAKAGLRLHF